MLSLFFRQPRLVALAFLVIVSAGASSLLTIGRQEDPTITNLFATISTVYPGADPARVESLVTERIEAELREVPEITVIESNSATGISVVSVELAETLTESEIDEAWDTVRREIEDARALFPVGVLEPEIDTDGAGTYTAIFSLQSAGNAPPSVAPRYAEELAQQLRRLPGTDRVQVFGAPEEEVRVTVDIHAAAAMGLSMDRIAAAVRDSDAKVQAGSLRTDRGEMLIEVEGEITALDRIRRIPLSTGMDGAVARLGDIATVERGVRTPVSETAIVDGAPAILVAARVEPGLQVDTWMAMVREEAGDFRRALPASLTLDQFFDQSTYTLDRLAEVGGNMALGVALVIAVLLVTLGLRSAVIVGLMLPVVSLASIATMQFAGMEIHQMSVTGLIVALGLLVDAAIVMADEVAKGLRHGSDRRAAVETAVRRLFGPLLASTVTTALSFMPMVLLPGPAGDFVGSIALAVIIMLFWSLATALTLTPALAGWFLRSGAGGGIRGGALARAFRWTLSWSMRHPVNAIGYALVLPLAGFLSFPTLTAQFFPGVERDQFTIEVEFPAGTAIDRTTEAIAELDAEIRAEGGIESIAWVIGRSAPAFYYNLIGNREQAPEFAQALVTTQSAEATTEIVPRLQRSLGPRWPGARILVKDIVQGPPVSAPVEIRIIGPDLEVLREEGDRLAGIMARVPEIATVRTDLDAGAPKLSFDIDEDRARLLGLDLTGVARQLDAALEGATGGSLIEGSEELPVRVQVAEAQRADAATIAALPILPPDADRLVGQGSYPAVPLSAIATADLVPSDSVIVRYQGERVNAVQGFTAYGVLPEEALVLVQAAMEAEGFAVPQGYRLSIGGDSEERAGVIGNLLASVGLIVTLSIATVVLTFNSFRLSLVTFMVAGLAAGLSILSLAVIGYPFGIMAVIGVIGSIGVSINAAIIILTGLQQDEDAAAGDPEAAVDVVMGSSRHIVSTTITTFGGFLPLILAGGAFWPPFAVSIAGGVLLSTVMSFYFTPPMFRLVYARRFRALRRAAASGRSDPIPQQQTPLPLAAE